MKTILSVVLILLSFSSLAQVKKNTVPVKKPAPKPVNSFALQMARGRKIYINNCMTCHMQDGSGAPRMNPPLAGAVALKGDKNFLIKTVLYGMKEIDIDGEFYQNAMPSFPLLTDQQVADVLTYVRNSFGNKASAVTVTEVRKMKGKK